MQFKAIVIQRYDNDNIDKWNRIESLKITPHVYNQQIFDSGRKNTQWEKDNLSLIEGIGKIGYPLGEECVCHYLSTQNGLKT